MAVLRLALTLLGHELVSMQVDLEPDEETVLQMYTGEADELEMGD